MTDVSRDPVRRRVTGMSLRNPRHIRTDVPAQPTQTICVFSRGYVLVISTSATDRSVPTLPPHDLFIFPDQSSQDPAFRKVKPLKAPRYRPRYRIQLSWDPPGRRYACMRAPLE
ncbi:hypothetical protein Bbelb_032610 [Branchiostoma belcheri]|nr:hypothetical protein Bbelb_032610 [Branchiostoma belcheri]